MSFTETQKKKGWITRFREEYRAMSYFQKLVIWLLFLNLGFSYLAYHHASNAADNAIKAAEYADDAQSAARQAVERAEDAGQKADDAKEAAEQARDN